MGVRDSSDTFLSIKNVVFFAILTLNCVVCLFELSNFATNSCFEETWSQRPLLPFASCWYDHRIHVLGNYSRLKRSLVVILYYSQNVISMKSWFVSKIEWFNSIRIYKLYNQRVIVAGPKCDVLNNLLLSSLTMWLLNYYASFVATCWFIHDFLLIY